MSTGSCQSGPCNVTSSANNWVYPSPTDHRCGYNEAPQIRTSWTESNPGRRFMGCCKFDTRHGCEWFKWNDPPICKRAKEIIPGLLRKINALKARTKEPGEITNLKEVEEKQMVEKLE